MRIDCFSDMKRLQVFIDMLYSLRILPNSRMNLEIVPCLDTKENVMFWYLRWMQP